MNKVVGRKATSKGPHVCQCGKRGAVSDVHSVESGSFRRRSYKCRCGHRWTTVEHHANEGRAIGKGGNSGETFDKNHSKLLRDRLLERIEQFLKDEAL